MVLKILFYYILTILGITLHFVWRQPVWDVVWSILQKSEVFLQMFFKSPTKIINTLTCLQSPRSPHGNSPKGRGNSHVTPSNATTTDTIFNYGYRRFYRCIVRFLWVVSAKVPWSSNWASKKLRNRKRVTFFNTWPVLSTS